MPTSSTRNRTLGGEKRSSKAQSPTAILSFHRFEVVPLQRPRASPSPAYPLSRLSASLAVAFVLWLATHCCNVFDSLLCTTCSSNSLSSQMGCRKLVSSAGSALFRLSTAAKRSSCDHDGCTFVRIASVCASAKFSHCRSTLVQAILFEESFQCALLNMGEESLRVNIYDLHVFGGVAHLDDRLHLPYNGQVSASRTGSAPPSTLPNHLQTERVKTSHDHG